MEVNLKTNTPVPVLLEVAINGRIKSGEKVV